MGDSPMSDAPTTPHVPLMTISALHYEWETPEEAFDRCLNELGLGGIEFSVVEGGARPHLLESEYDAVRDLGAAWPLELSGHVWGNLPQMDAEGALEQLRRWLEIARHLRFVALVVHGGTHDDQWAGIEMMTDVFGEVAPEYAAGGVTLCLENHYAWDYHDGHELFSSVEEFRHIFDRVPGPGLGFCLDYGHSHMTGNTEELLREVGGRMVYTHLADNFGEHDDHVAFGEGTVPWREVLTLTRDVGYRGPFTVEFPVREDRGPMDECIGLIGNVYG